MIIKKQNSYFSTSLEKGLNILRLFSRDRSAWTLTQIAKSIGINKTSAFRFTNTLVELGYLKKNPSTKLLSLGPQVIGLALAFSQTETVSQISKPFIDEVSETYKLTIELALFEEDILVVVYRRDAQNGLVPRFPVIRTSDRFYCTSLGKAVLSHLPSNELENIVGNLSLLPKTRYSIVDKSKLLADLRTTRERGYALNNEEWAVGLIAIGAPILNLNANKVVGAVSFDFAAPRSSMKMVEAKYAKLLLELARDISQGVTIQH